ncbi:hypothetical protein FJT64_001821 [Amphibalanus amphitrite]|uniref:Pacifastin domain-containing protein n=1 Tax=Amphibalanus amphitrite TaxID=1232801 RepID=A0A6A4WXH5_AMPAM|nr:hypothetical protein FJT64_001821 [Amphibalanus amphitrite]KAF0311808.1 hypothetical protein FJT64_001821 [Amphibalanus amphitrite]
MSGGRCAAVPALRAALLLLCCLQLSSTAAGESWGRLRPRARRGGGLPHLFQLNARTYLACMLLSDDEAGADSGEEARVSRGVPPSGADPGQQLCSLTDVGGSLCTGSSRLADRIASRRPASSPRRTTTRRPAPADPAFCPSGVTYFDGCNSCSCGTEQLCTLKACNADTTVQIFDPCSRVTCGYHQRCQAICVGQVCQLKPLCVSGENATGTLFDG